MTINHLKGQARRLALMVALWALIGTVGAALSPAEQAPSLPPFTATGAEHWLASPPLTLAQLSGQVVLVHFWAFECWNCYRSFPWLNRLHQSLKDQPFLVIGIHTPEFEREKDRTRLAAKMATFELEHAVMMDNDYAYWRALANRYWPSWYIVDQQGRIRSVYIGEIHHGDAQAQAIEDDIGQLLKAR